MYYCIDYEVVTITQFANCFKPTAGLKEPTEIELERGHADDLLA